MAAQPQLYVKVDCMTLLKLLRLNKYERMIKLADSILIRDLVLFYAVSAADCQVRYAMEFVK